MKDLIIKNIHKGLVSYYEEGGVAEENALCSHFFSRAILNTDFSVANSATAEIFEGNLRDNEFYLYFTSTQG